MLKLKLWLPPPHIQAAMPKPTTPATTFTTKFAKAFAKTTKKKKNRLWWSQKICHNCSIKTKKWKDDEDTTNANLAEEEDDQESDASS